MNKHLIFLTISLFAFIFIATTCSKKITTVPYATNTYKYLALGDSYTIGESVAASERWSVILADLLRQKQIAIGSPTIIARTGWTTAELTDAIDKAPPKHDYDLVSLLIGVNNQYRGQSTERYRTEFRKLLQMAIEFAQKRPNRVFVLSIPDWGVTPFAQGKNTDKIAKEIDTFNDVAKEECQKVGVTFIDITSLSRTVQNDISLVADDKLHFSGKMYRQWAEKSLSIVELLLK